MDNVFLTVVFFSIYEGFTHVGAHSEYAQSSSLTVVNARHGLLRVNIDERHVGTGIRHTTLDLHFLMVRQDVFAERHQ